MVIVAGTVGDARCLKLVVFYGPAHGAQTLALSRKLLLAAHETV